MPRIALALFICSVAFVLGAGPVRAAQRPLPDLHPPIGVFGEQVHAKGHAMFSYRYQHLDMDGLMVGRSEVSAAEVLRDSSYSVVPDRLSVNTHVFEAMWVPLSEVTFVLQLPFIDKEMRQIRRNGDPFTTRATGFGDVRLSLLYRVFEDDTGFVHLNLGISLPSGATNVTDVTPTSGSRPERLPYVMQLGSGTVDLLPGVTYNGKWRNNGWGTQLSGVLRAGTNARGYTLGNRYTATGWFGRRWLPWLDTSFRMQWQQWFDPNGEDEQLALVPGVSPLADSGKQGGRRLDALFSIDFYAPSGSLRGARLALEAGLPAYQSLDGPQLRAKWLMTAGIQYAF